MCRDAWSLCARLLFMFVRWQWPFDMFPRLHAGLRRSFTLRSHRVHHDVLLETGVFGWLGNGAAVVANDCDARQRIDRRKDLFKEYKPTQETASGIVEYSKTKLAAATQKLLHDLPRIKKLHAAHPYTLRFARSEANYDLGRNTGSGDGASAAAPATGVTLGTR